MSEKKENERRATALVIGASSGVGRATALALAGEGVRVWAVGRDGARLAQLGGELVGAGEGAGEILPRALDATDAVALDAVIAEAAPDLIVVTAGARARLGLIPEQTWESFSAPWNTDVKIAFHVGQSVLRRPLRAGSLVIFVSSGAALGGSALSGGYAGAKRMQMFLAEYLQRAADVARLDVRFVALVPKQLLAGTELGETVATAYARLGGMTRDAFMARFGAPLTADGVARALAQISRGEVGREGNVLGVTGSGVERL